MGVRTVFRRSEIDALAGSARVRRELRAGRWTSPVRGVVVCHNGPASRSDVIEIALCAGPARAVVGGSTALELDGLTGLKTPDPFIVLPEGAREPVVEAATYHWSTELSALDVRLLRLPPRTRVPRSVVDAASWSTKDRRARVWVIASVQQGLTTVEHVRDALTRRGTCRHRAVIKQTLLDVEGGVNSLPERDFDSIRRAAGLPVPSRQSRFSRPDGRAYLDVEWSEFGAAAEIHGIPHLQISQWDDDLDRANDVVIGGPRLLVFSSFGIRHRPARIARQLDALLRRGGWTGPTLPDEATLLQRLSG